jgi:hypothetical protein
MTATVPHFVRVVFSALRSDGERPPRPCRRPLIPYFGTIDSLLRFLMHLMIAYSSTNSVPFLFNRCSESIDIIHGEPQSNSFTVPITNHRLGSMKIVGAYVSDAQLSDQVYPVRL